jgi:hypothetical protein
MQDRREAGSVLSGNGITAKLSGNGPLCAGISCPAPQYFALNFFNFNFYLKYLAKKKKKCSDTPTACLSLLATPDLLSTFLVLFFLSLRAFFDALTLTLPRLSPKYISPAGEFSCAHPIRIQHQIGSPFDLQRLTRFRAVIMEDSVMEELLSLRMLGGSM